MKRVLALTTAALLVATVAIASPGKCGKSCRMSGEMGKGMGMHEGMRGPGMMMHGDGAGMGHILMMAEELQLTDQQKEKFQALRTAHQMERIDREAELKKARVRMGDLRRNDNAAEADVMAAIDEMARLRADMQKMQYRHHQAFRAILTDKQQQQLKEMRLERMHRNWDFDDDDDDDEDDDGDTPEPPRAPRAPRPPRGGNN